MQAALQIRCSGPPQRRASNAEYGPDLRLRHPAIQRGEHVRPIDLATVMQTFASNLLHHSPILVTQLKSSLLHEHTSVRETATDVLYSCFDIYVSTY